jgi:AsmA protein
MKGKLRIVVIVAVVLVLLLIVLPFVIPVNQFRPAIEEKASAALARKVLVGNLSLSLLTGSLAAEELSIADDPKFGAAPFLTAKSVKVGVEMIPLIFSRQLHVTGVTIVNPEVTLLHTPGGKWNYSSIGGAGSPAKSQGSAPSEDFTIQKLELKNGKIVVGAANSQKRSSYSNVNIMASDVSLKAKFPVTVSADLPGGGNFKLDGKIGPVDEADAALTPLDATLTVKEMNLGSTGFLDPALGLGGIVDLDSTLANAHGSAETKGTLKLAKALFVQGGSPAGVPATVEYSTTYDLRKSAGVLNPSTIKIGSAAAHLNGTYETAGEETAVNIKLIGESMPARDLEAFLPAIGIHLPKGAALTEGTLSTNLNIKGPTNKLVTDGTIGLFSGKLEGFDLGSRMSEISMLTGLKTGKDLKIEKMTTDVHMATTGLRAENFDAVLPDLGTLVGGGTVDAKNNLDFKMAATLTGGAIGAIGSGGDAVGGLLGKVTGSGTSNCKGGTKIPFMIHGTTADPKFVPDVGGVAAGFLKGQLGCAGGAATGAGKQNPTDNIGNALGGLFGKKKKP